MEWNKRASKAEVKYHGLMESKHWKTRDGRYRVTRSKWLGRGVLPTVFYACVRAEKCWKIISEHRKASRAFKACESHATRYSVPARKRRRKVAAV